MKKNISPAMLAAINAITPFVPPLAAPKSERVLRYEEMLRLRRLADSALLVARSAEMEARRAKSAAESVYAEIKVCCEVLEQDLGIDPEQDEHEEGGVGA